MNKNTLFAFVLILASVTFFSSPVYHKFWVEKIQGKKYEPLNSKVINTEKQEVTEEIKKEEFSKVKEEEKKNEIIQLSESINNDTTIDSLKNVSEKVDTIWIENKKMIVGISEKGANIVSIKMKDYKYTESDSLRKKGDLIDIIPKNNRNAAQLSISGESFDNIKFDYKDEKSKRIKVKENGTEKIVFSFQNGEETLNKEFIINYDSYKIGLDIKQNNLSGKRVKVSWESGIEESEIESNANSYEKRGVHYYNGESVNHINLKKEGKESTTGQCRWIGVTSKYFFVSLISDSISDADITYTGFEENKKNKELNYGISYEKTAENNSVKFMFYTGPSKYNDLKNENIKFEKVLFPVTGWTKNILFADSWFPPIAEFVLWILLMLTKIVKDYGIAILLLTLLSKVVTYPMMHSSTKQMNKMRDLQPKMTVIREKFKNNPRKMNEELMNLYRKEGVNPLNPGCLPMFLQMPIFIALFVVLKKAIELRETGTFILPWVSDLSKPETLISLKGIFQNGLPMYGSSIALMPILMAVIQYYQSKMTIKDPNQKAMIYFMPIFMLVLFNNFPAGVVLYWTFQSGLGLVQQIITDRKTIITKEVSKRDTGKNAK